jgi:hypothetical protein
MEDGTFTIIAQNDKQETRNKITVQIAFSTFQKKIIFNRTILKYL